MKKYKYILLDADDTLFDFKRSEKAAFLETCGEVGLDPDDAVYERYHEINDMLWKRLERGEVTRDKLKELRYAMLLDEIGETNNGRSAQMAAHYVVNLGKQHYLLDDSLEVCERLSRTYPLYVITNGITTVQLSRMSLSEIKKYITRMYISEEIGYAKPSADYFRYVLSDIGTDGADCLVVGDSLTSDIDGAINSGLDCVWVNADGSDNNGRKPTYTVKRLIELYGILGL